MSSDLKDGIEIIEEICKKYSLLEEKGENMYTDSQVRN